jgi:PAS domain-containing protein
LSVPSTGQKEIEMILTRQLASYLAMPIFIVDPSGNLVFYNEPAEAILGRRFEETGEMPADEWAIIFRPTDEEGKPVPSEKLPLVIALTQKKPAHLRFRIKGLDNVLRDIEVTAFPLIGEAGRDLGAVAIFWDMKK